MFETPDETHPEVLRLEHKYGEFRRERDALKAEVARLSALVQGMETWLTKQERKSDELAKANSADMLEWVAVSSALHLTLAELQRLKGQP